MSEVLLVSVIAESRHLTTTNGIVATSVLSITPTAPLITPAVESCASIASTDDQRAKEIESALGWLKEEGFDNLNCVLIKVDQYNDIAAVLNGLPENTTIFLSTTQFASEEAAGTGKVSDQEGFLVLSSIYLKSGQHLMGVAAGDKKVSLTAQIATPPHHTITVGKPDSFESSKVNESVIDGFRFKTNGRHHLDSRKASVIHPQCYNYDLIIRNNEFNIDRGHGVLFKCPLSNKKVSTSRLLPAEQGDPGFRGGSGLKFTNNTVKLFKDGPKLIARSGVSIETNGTDLRLHPLYLLSLRACVLGC